MQSKKKKSPYHPTSDKRRRGILPKKQIRQGVTTGTNKANANFDMYAYLRQEWFFEEVFKPMLFIVAGLFACWVLDFTTKNSRPVQRQLEFVMPVTVDDIIGSTENLHNVSMADFIKLAKRKGVLDQVLGINQILEDLQPQLDQMSEEKKLDVFTRLIYRDFNTGETFDTGVSIPLDWAINKNKSTPATHTDRPNPLLLNTSIYITTTYVNGQFVHDDNNNMVFLKRSVELTDNPEEQHTITYKDKDNYKLTY